MGHAEPAPFPLAYYPAPYRNRPVVALRSLWHRVFEHATVGPVYGPGPYSAPRLRLLLVRKAKFFGPHVCEHVVSQYVERVVYRSIRDCIQPKLDQ